MLITLFVVTVLAISTFIFLQQEKFGKRPSGERSERIKRSPHFKNGEFKNLSNTPALTEGASYTSILYEFFLKKKIRRIPIDLIPNKKTDLRSLDVKEDILIWFGHSSYFMQIDGKRILVDPVLSGAASPIPSTTPSFKGSDVYTMDEFPEIDILFLTHDHWDHLDHKTTKQLKPKIKKVITGLGTGQHLERWGYNSNIIIEKDWNEEIDLGNGFIVNTCTARHFSGRGLKRNQALWLSFAYKTPSMNIYIGGDSGYDTHFAEIGKKFGPFDLALLENGQYDKNWKYIHMMPEEVLQAGMELNAKRIFPIHSAKFALGNHPWDEPLSRVTQLNIQTKLNVITPMIGEKVDLKDLSQPFTHWWTDLN